MRSASVVGADVSAGARPARGFKRLMTLMRSASSEEVARELAALAALGALRTLLADLHDLGWELDAVLLGGGVDRRSAGHLGLRRALLAQRALRRSLVGSPGCSDRARRASGAAT